MSLPEDPLAKYKVAKSESVEEQPTATEEASNDPLAKYKKASGPQSKRQRDYGLEEMKKAGVEPRPQDIARARARYQLGESARGGLSGATLGTSEFVPFLKPEGTGASVAGEVVGSAAVPLGLVVKGAKYIASPLYKLATKSPLAKKSLDAFTHLTSIGATGAASGAIHEATEGDELKAPSISTALEHGATWVALDAALQGLGWAGRFTKGLIRQARKQGKTPEQMLNLTLEQAGSGGTPEEIAKRALDVVEKNKTIGDVAQRNIDKKIGETTDYLKTKKIDPKDFTKLQNTQPEPYLPGEFDFVPQQTAENIVDSELESSIEKIGERAPTERELGVNIKEDIENQIGVAEAEVDDLYKIASEGEGAKNPDLTRTSDALVQEIQKIQGGGIKLSPEGYTKAEKQLIQTLEDLGYSIIRNEEGLVTGAARERMDTLTRAVDIKKRLNKIIDYDLKETGAQDFLKNPVAQLRKDIRDSYGPKDSVQRQAFERAERLHGEKAEKLKKKSILNSRYSEKPEELAKTIKTPSGLHDLKEVVSEGQFRQIEREILENLKSLSEEKAAKFYREIRPALSQDTRVTAEQIINSKSPASSPNLKTLQKQKLQDRILNDISEASITGGRPEKALDLWKTKEGQQLIKNSLEGNPNKDEIIKYLSETSFNDFAASVVGKDGTIDFGKLDKLLKDPATLSNLELVAGKEGVDFLRQLETISDRAKKNFSMIEGKLDKASARERGKFDQELNDKFKGRVKTRNEALKEKELSDQTAVEKLVYKMDDMMQSYGIKAKGALALVGISVAPGTTVALTVSYELLKKIMKSPSIRKSAREAATTTDPVKLLKVYSAIDNAVSGQD